jgi:uncharacterized phage-associated protein
MEPSLVVAQTFLDLAKEDRVRISAGQLHKLVYFAHGLHLGAFNGKPLIDENVFAWTFGPLIPEVYNVVQRYSNELGYELPLRGMEPIGHHTDYFKSIRSTWDAYKNCTNIQLDLVVCAPGSPWDEVWHQDQEHFKIIPNSIIQAYYVRALRKGRPAEQSSPRREGAPA